MCIRDSSNDEESPLRFFRRESLRRLASSSEEENETEALNLSLNQHQLLRAEQYPLNWNYTSPLVVKYVDDILGSEPLFIPAGKTHVTTNKTLCTIHAKNSEELIHTIKERALDLGLKVNGKKTQMTCISASTSTSISTIINFEEERIRSEEEMKILGFYFDHKPSIGKHIEEIGKKFRRRLWFVRHLKKAIKKQEGTS